MDNQSTNVESSPAPAKGANTKKIIIWIIVIAVIAAALILSKRIFMAASVNGSYISNRSLNAQLQKQYGKQILDALVVEKLIDQEAKNKNIEITQEIIDAEIKNIEAQFASQGSTLESTLDTQGLTLDDLMRQISLQKKLEAILADKIQVTEEEVDGYIKDNKVEIPKGEELQLRSQIKGQLAQQKLAGAAQVWIAEVKSAAEVKYY